MILYIKMFLNVLCFIIYKKLYLYIINTSITFYDKECILLKKQIYTQLPSKVNSLAEKTISLLAISQ